MKFQNIQRVAVLLALSVFTFTTSCYAESKEDYVFYAIPANGKVITIPFISLGEAQNDEPIYGTGKHKQFRYCRLSGKDIETFQCSESRSGKPSVIYRRMPRYPEGEVLSLFKQKLILSEDDDLSGYYVCENGCGKEIPRFVFMVRYRYNLLFGDYADSAISEIGAYDEWQEKADKAHKKGTWLALQRVKNGWQLVPVKPKFKIEPPRGCTTVGIISVNIPDADILLSDNSLTPGGVESSWKGNLSGDQPFLYRDKNPGLPNIGEERKLYLNKHQYSLKNKDGHIFLSFQGKSQYLFDYSDADNTNARIVWIGDLDRDGKMDIIFDASDDWAIHELRLYLSGKAAAGSLVKLVAKRRNGGSC